MTAKNQPDPNASPQGEQKPIAPSEHEQWRRITIERAGAFFTPERRRALFGKLRLELDVVPHAPLYRALSLLNADGSLSPKQVRKLMQINHLLVLLAPPFLDLQTHCRGQQVQRVHIIDVGCGSAYLTTLLAWAFEHVYQLEARILGVDRNAALVEKAQQRSDRLGLSKTLRFAARELSPPQIAEPLCELFTQTFPEAKIAKDKASTRAVGDTAINAIVALHACDTATDYALAAGVELGAELLAVAPCCQSELARRLDLTSPMLAAFAHSPHLKRDLCATLTDALRMAALEESGYQTQAIEFVPSEHTKKNTLLRASRFARSKAGKEPPLTTSFAAMHAALGSPKVATTLIVGRRTESTD